MGLTHGIFQSALVGYFRLYHVRAAVFKWIFQRQANIRDSILYSVFCIPMTHACSKSHSRNAKSLETNPLRTPCKKQLLTTLNPTTQSALLTLHDLTLVTPSWLVGILLLLNLPNHKLKSFGDILVIPCACFRIGTIELLSQGFALLNSNFTLIRT